MVAAAESFPAPAFASDSPVPAVLARVFAPPSDLSEVKYAEANVILSEKESRTNPGPYQLSVTPHTGFIQECFGNPALRQVTIKKNDQAAITRSVFNRIHRIVDELPRNVLYVINSREEATRISHRLEASLLASPATRAKLRGSDEEAGADGSADVQVLTYYLEDMDVYFVGGGSIGAVANKQISVIVIDEADKIPRIKGPNGQLTHVVDEAKSRFKSVPAGDALLIVLSKPATESDITTTEYRKGTMRKGYMPCPHCFEMQEFVQDRLRFDHCRQPSRDFDRARVLDETYYECVRAGTTACPDGKIYDRHRTFCVSRIEYRATNPNPDPEHESFELSDFLLDPTYFADASFGRIALDLIDGFKKPGDMPAIQARRFGKEELAQAVDLKEDDVLVLRGNYRRGTVPRGLVYFALFSDFQGTGPKWVKGGFRRNGELVISDWGSHLALDDLVPELDVDIPEVDESQPLVPEVPQPPTGRHLRCMEGGIDEGYKTEHVRDFCLRSNFRFIPTKGSHTANLRGSVVSPSITTHKGVEFQVYHFNDSQFKRALYLDRMRDHRKIVAGKTRVPRMWLPIDVDEEFVTEIRNEVLLQKKDKYGILRPVWQKNGPNDRGDGVKGLLVMWHVVQAAVLAALEEQERQAALTSPPANGPR